MLLGAFLIGLWLGWALWAKYKAQIDKMALETQSHLATAEALRSELQTIKTNLASTEADRSALALQVDSINRNNINLLQEVQDLESRLAVASSLNRQLDTELGLAQTPDQTPAEDLIPLEITVIEPVVDVSAEEPAPIAEKEAAAMEENTPPAAFVIEPVALTEPQPERKKSSKKADSEATGVVVAAAASDREDLTVVEGIGPKIQMLLNQYGIYTYRQLAETDVERLKDILSNAGSQLAMHDPGTWPSQANLAANDQWDTLKSVQGFLKGGKKPT